MSDIEREAFEQAVTDRWSDSYSFTRFGDEDYYDEVLEGMWQGWQASRQALEGEPVAVVDRVGIMQRLSPYTNLPEGTKLYTHPASAQAPEEIERDGINSTENLAYIDGYNDCAKEVRENARSNKQAASVPKHWRETMSDFQREERYVVFKLRDLVETEKDAVLRLANSINAQEIECVIVESDWPNYEHTWQTIERVSDGSYSDPYAEIERLQSRVAELEITHDGQAASMPEANKAWASSDPSWVLAHLKEETLFDTESIGEMLAFAKAAATSIPAKAANVPEWIKCSDKMPKINSPVVVARISDNDGKPCLDSGVAALQPNNGWVGLGVFYRPKIDAGTIYQNDLSVMDVTHWMPLPDPPKQEQSHE